MNIQLNLTNENLIICNDLLKPVYNNSTTFTQHGKIVKSIALDVADRIDHKCKSLYKKATLFDTSKKHKLTLKYYEAWGLYEVLVVVNAINENAHSRIVVQNIIATLHQKLA